MNIIYQSPNYDPAKITNRYLHIDLATGKPVVEEMAGNYTVRSYELPDEDYYRYGKALDKALKYKGLSSPNAVDFVED